MSCHRDRSGKGTVLNVPPPVIVICKASQEFIQKSSSNPRQRQNQNSKHNKSESIPREATHITPMTTAKIF